jgi:transposase InsO family protein
LRSCSAFSQSAQPHLRCPHRSSPPAEITFFTGDELSLALNEIEHRRTRVRTPRTNGFVERFNGTVLDAFFRVAMREKVYASVEALQADLDAWLIDDNTERPHLGYRNQARRPIETIQQFIRQEG